MYELTDSFRLTQAFFVLSSSTTKIWVWSAPHPASCQPQRTPIAHSARPRGLGPEGRVGRFAAQIAPGQHRGDFGFLPSQAVCARGQFSALCRSRSLVERPPLQGLALSRKHVAQQLIGVVQSAGIQSCPGLGLQPRLLSIVIAVGQAPVI
jgi:hypothetical protein